MYNLVDHRENVGSHERNKYFAYFESVLIWLGYSHDEYKTVYDVNEKLRDEACGEAYYELKIEN